MNRPEVLIGITGGIAAYKTATLVSRLSQWGAGVSVIMTRSATELVGPKTFEALSGRPVRVELFASSVTHPHIELSQAASLLCVAPATANFLAKAAGGIADDLLSTTYLSFSGPVILAPAMNTSMWRHAAVKRNLDRLQKDGITIIGPAEGRLSCGQTGPGRMVEPEALFTTICKMLESPPTMI
jgi:phosphopantothenoylcysteine decarboxylase/phosphopantothenate--cysteine ligase